MQQEVGKELVSQYRPLCARKQMLVGLAGIREATPSPMLPADIY